MTERNLSPARFVLPTYELRLTLQQQANRPFMEIFTHDDIILCSVMGWLYFYYPDQGYHPQTPQETLAQMVDMFMDEEKFEGIPARQIDYGMEALYRFSEVFWLDVAAMLEAHLPLQNIAEVQFGQFVGKDLMLEALLKGENPWHNPNFTPRSTMPRWGCPNHKE